MKNLPLNLCVTEKGSVYVRIDHERTQKGVTFYFQKKSSLDAGTDEDVVEIHEELQAIESEMVTGSSYSHMYGYEQNYESGNVTPDDYGYDEDQGIEEAGERAEKYLIENF